MHGCLAAVSLASAATITGMPAGALVALVLVVGATLFLIDRIVRAQARQSRAALVASEAREQRLIDAAHDFAIYELDREGRILTWNKGAERLKGWKAEEIIGKPYNVLHTPESRARSMRCNGGRGLVAPDVGGEVLLALQAGRHTVTLVNREHKNKLTATVKNEGANTKRLIKDNAL